MDQPKMQYSDNPYIDAIVYYTKYLITNSVLKDEVEADNNETLLSIKRGGEYVRKIKYDHEDDPDYIEINPYYSTLWGQPTVPTIAEIQAVFAHVQDTMDLDSIDPTIYADMYYISMNQYEFMIPSGVELDLKNKFLHTLTETEVMMCESCGIMDAVRNDYGSDPHYKYIEFVGHKIDPVISRTASKFQLLYVPPLPDDDYNDLKSKFEIIFEKNKRYVMSAIYSDAMAFQNVYYDKFIIILLKVMTMMDMVNDVFDYLIHKDVFDSRTIRYLFESYGVEYYSEIPTKYQIAMIKNMNTLLKYKSTNRNIVDICNLFGFPNVTVFKYYLLKVHDPESGYKFNADGTEDFSEGYDLEFVKVPIDGKLDDYINNPDYREPYDDIAGNDPFWITINNNQTDVFKNADVNALKYDVRQQIINTDFTCEETKYFSIDSTEDVAASSIDLCYFYNMIYDGIIEDFTIKLPDSISVTPVPVGQVFAYMTALGYVYNGVEDDIIAADMEKNLYIHGFNFDYTDIDALLIQIRREHTTIRDNFDSLDTGGNMAIVDNFEWPPTGSSGIEYTYEIFERVFLKDREFHDKLREAMKETDNYHVYSGYEKVYDTLMTTKNTLKYFTKLYFAEDPTAEWDCSITYTKWFDRVNYSLAKSIADCKAMTNTEKRTATISNIFDECVYALKDVFTNERFANIYNVLPTKSADFLISCIVKVINFFKSYKAQFISSSSMFILKDDDQETGFLEDTAERFTLVLPQTMSFLEDMGITYKDAIYEKETLGALEKVYVKETTN